MQITFMKKELRRGLRRFRVEVSSWTDYVERIDELERALAKKPRELHIEIVGTGEISADSALRFRAALTERSMKTRIVTHARSSLLGGSVLLWLLGERRTIRDDARICFRRTTLSEEDAVRENGVWKSDQPRYQDSYSTIDPDEGDYARVLEIINEFLPVNELAGRLIGAPVLQQFGLIENDKVDDFLAAAFSSDQRAAKTSNPSVEGRVRRREKVRARQMRK
jgi:hypothetical protein